jgi:hypothetical protein
VSTAGNHTRAGDQPARRKHRRTVCSLCCPPVAFSVGGRRGAGGAASSASQPNAAMVVDAAHGKAPVIPMPAVPSASVPKGKAIDIPESSEKGAQKKGKPYCYRCRTKGHTIHECTVILCCELCFGDHITKQCPNSKKN